MSTWTKCQVYLIKLISVGDSGLGSEPFEPKKSWNLSEEASEAPVVFEASEWDLELLDSGTNSDLILILLDLELPMICVVDLLEVVNQLLRATSCTLSILESDFERGRRASDREKLTSLLFC